MDFQSFFEGKLFEEWKYGLIEGLLFGLAFGAAVVIVLFPTPVTDFYFYNFWSFIFSFFSVLFGITITMKLYPNVLPKLSKSPKKQKEITVEKEEPKEEKKEYEGCPECGSKRRHRKTCSKRKELKA